MAEFRMPSLGADMDAGTLLEWRVHPGDRVERGDIVAVVDTQKAAIEVEIFASGVIDELEVEEGEKVPVGTVLATVREEKEAAPPPAAPAPKKAPRRLRISPAARRRALELDIDPATVEGTGPHGAIALRDIEAAAGGDLTPRPPRPSRPPAPEAPPPEAPPPADRRAQVRAAIAAAMTRSNREIPHYYLATTINMAPATAHLAALNAERRAADRLLPGALLLRAVVVALAEVPELNGFWEDGGARESEAIHLGTAISLRGGGVMAPAILDAGQLSPDQLMERLRDLVRRARAGRLRSSELSDSTITVTSLGERGPEAVYGVIYPPQVALVGFGSIVERPWAQGGALKAQPVITATLAGDHRASDGHRGGLFLEALAGALEHPEDL